MKKHGYKLFMTFALIIGFVFSAIGAQAEETSSVVTDSELAGELELLFGDGHGLSADYLAKTTTRMQAAIIMLRLKGLEHEAMMFAGADNFVDANKVGQMNQATLGYLKAHPDLGWAGVGGNRFDPITPVTVKEIYKVLLEIAGYKTGADFQYADVLAFAKSHGLWRAASNKTFTNASLATAIVEGLGLGLKDQAMTLGEALVADSLIEESILKKAGSARVDVAVNAELGSYLVDGAGRTLYYFTKDADNINACQGPCIDNWPIYYTDNLTIGGGMSKEDFGQFTREGGTKQLTYKGWPLYYFIKDMASGDVFGQDVNHVWYVIDPHTMQARTADNTEPASPAQSPVPPSTPAKTGVNHKIEMKEYAFSKTELTIKAGDSVTFTNRDDMQHNAVAESGAFKVPLLNKGESYTITLDKPGTYDYYCEPHRKFMIAKIIVE